MKSNYTLFLPFFFLGIVFLHAQKSYTDSIYELRKTLSNTDFIQAVIDIPYDEAVKRMSTFEMLTELAVKKSKELNNSSLLAKSLMMQAKALHFSTKDNQAIDLTLQAIQIFDSINDTENAAKSYLELGWKLKRRKLDDAFLYMQKGLRTLEKTKNKADLVGSYNNFGVLYQMKGNLDSALYFHQKSLQLSKKLEDSIGIPFAHTEIAFVLLKNKKFDIAKRHLDSSLVIRKKRNDTYGLTDSYLYLGDLYFEKKEYNNAIKYFQLGYDLANKNQYFPLKKYAVEYLHKSYEENKDYQASLEALKLFQTLKDSVLNKETNAKIEELQIEFETAKKEKALAQQELEIKNQTLTSLILGCSIILISLLFWSYYKRGKLKRLQLEKEMELKEALAKIQTKNKLQEQRLEISRDLHDNIGSQLTFIISSIENLKYVSKELGKTFQEKLSGISGFTTDTIHQLRDTIWAMNKTEISFQEFHSRLLNYVEKAKIASKNIDYQIHTDSIDYTFSSLEGMHLFRVIQEAMNNSMKYAQADKISIEFSMQKGILEIIISDNGMGFDIEKTSSGNGLINMETRIEKINGQLNIYSKKGEGTTISIKL